MKIAFFLIGLLFAIATAAPDKASSDDPEQEESLQQRIRYPIRYRPGKTYHYWYNAQILTGATQTSNQYTGHKLIARVRLAMRAGRRVHLALDQIQILETNSILPVDRPVVVLPRNRFNNIGDTKVGQLMMEKLKLALSFSFNKSGSVSGLQTHREDEFWSINMKKAIASMLNVDMQVKVDRILKTNGIWKQTQDFEDGIDGQCKSSYSYTRFPYTERNARQSNKNLITVVKNRDLLQCQKKPWMQHALFTSQQCQQTRRPISAQTETRYNATKSMGDDFFLRQILVLSQYAFTPESGNNGSITTYVVQRLRFSRDVGRIEVKLPESESQTDKLGLRMILPIPEMKGSKSSSQKLMSLAKGALTAMLVQYNQDKIEMYDRMRQFIEVSRKMSSADIKQVWLSKLREPEVSAKSRKMVLGLLPKIATKQSIKVINDLIKDQELPDEETSMLVSPLGAMTFVSKDDMVTMLMKTAEKMKGMKQRQTYKSLLLTIGQLINTRYNSPVPKEWRPIPHPLLTRQRIRQFYKRILNRPSSILEWNTRKMIVAMSLGNCGVADPCLDILEDLIPVNKRIKRSVRSQAIMSLTQLAGRAPLRIRKIVMPIFFDQREDVELRLAAYIVFVKTRPSRSELKIVTNNLILEKSQQMRSFVLSHLQEISQMTDDRCFAGFANNASRVLDDVKQESFGAQYSNSASFTFRSLIQLTKSLLTTPKSFLPRDAAVRLMSQAMGINVELVQLIAKADEAQALLQRLMGPDGTLRLSQEIEKLLKPTSGKQKENMDFIGIIRKYGSTYGMSGLPLEVTNMLRKGQIPLSPKWFELVTQGGVRQDQMEYTLFADKLTKVATTFGVPFSANITITGHVKLWTSLKLQPKLFAKTVGASLKIKHRASIRQQLRVGADLTLLSSFLCADSHLHMPKSQINTIKIAWHKQNTEGQNLNTALRINVNRPAATTKVLSLSSRLHSVLERSIRVVNPIVSKKPLKHRSLPSPRRESYDALNAQSLGLKLQVRTLFLNSSGITNLAKLPFHTPADLKLYIVRDQEVAGKQSIDVTARVKTQTRDIRDIVQKVFPKEANDSALTQEQQEELASQVGEIQRVRVQAELRLRNFTIGPVPTLETEDIELPRPIGRLEIHDASLTAKGVSALWIKIEKLSRQRWSYSYHGLLIVNKKILQARFDRSKPLKMETDAKAVIHGAVRVNRRLALLVKAEGTMGDFWIKTIQRIKGNEKKQLSNFPDLQKCQKDIKLQRPDSPACEQAWKDINALSRAILEIRIRRDAPHWMRKIPLAVHNALRRKHADALISSNLTSQMYPWVQQLRLDHQLSPYDQQVTNMYLKAMRIIDRFVNARHIMTAKNSFTMSPTENIQANLFDLMYPATCHVVSKQQRMNIRTFDKLDFNTRAVLNKTDGGRIVLVQDIYKRLLVAEQRSASHRVTFIRLKEKTNHVLVAVNEKLWPQIPVVIYKGKVQKLPFELKNKDGQVILRAIREPWVRSQHAITVQLPKLGSVVKTHPLVATEIILDPFFHSNVRGICGDFDGELEDETKGPRCMNVYRRPIDFIKRYATVLAKVPSLKQLEVLPSMIRFMPASKCRDGRRYPNLR